MAVRKAQDYYPECPEALLVSLAWFALAVGVIQPAFHGLPSSPFAQRPYSDAAVICVL